MSNNNSDGFNKKHYNNTDRGTFTEIEDHTTLEIDIPRYCVGISVDDGETGESLIEEGFNTPKLEYVIVTLESVIEKLKKMSFA